MRSSETTTVRFASDSRGRVPFALVAVLLLVGSSAFAMSLSLLDEARVDDSIDTALDRTTAATRPALRDAVATAARDAARRPIVRRANTSYGRVLNKSTPFRDALRVRIYLAARERLPATRYRHRGVTAVASLPATPNAGALRAAKRRVRIDTVDGGRSLQVTVPVTLTARRVGSAGSKTTSDANGTAPPLVRERERFRVTVATPILLLHDRTERFETRLDRGPLKPGLGQHLTARLYPVTWARGAAQYAGGPIENVVANRHVALATNGGVLATQRATFGRTDPEAVESYGRATVRTGYRDVLAVTPPPDGEVAAAVLPSTTLTGERRGSADADRPASASKTGRTWSPGGPQPDGVPGTSLTVGVNGSADEAFLRFVAGDPATVSATRARLPGNPTRPGFERNRTTGPRRLDSVLRGQYRAEFWLETTVDRVRVESNPAPRPAGDGWTLNAEWRSTTTVVESIGTSNAAWTTNSGDPWTRAIDRFARSVTVHETTTRVWVNGTTIRRTNATRTTVSRVTVALVGQYVPIGPSIPDRPVQPLFRTGGASGGRNLDPAVDTARDRLIVSQDGRDGVARAVVQGDLDQRRTTVDRNPPDGLRARALADVALVRERVRNVSVRVDRAALASGGANPAARLTVALRERRASLVDAPREYDGVADRARVAARAAYVDHAIDVVSEQAERRQTSNHRLANVLASAGLGAPASVRAVSSARENGRVPGRRTWGGTTDRVAPGGAVALVPDGDPAYLTLAAVDRRHVSPPPANGSYHPLAARNLNLFTVPYGDAVDVVADGGRECGPATGSGSVRLRAAGRVLIAANETLAMQANETLRERRDRLAFRTRGALDGVRRRAVVALTRQKRGDVPKLETSDARTAVSAGVGRWDGMGQRAVAAANGSLAVAIAEEAAEREAMNRTERDLLATYLRVELRYVAARSTVEYGTVNRTTNGVRSVVHEVLKREAKLAAGNLTEQAAEEALGPKFRGIPAGLPLLPVPGYWVATVNVWHVEVRGGYARFSVHARTGTPASPAGLTYVREAATVALDVDGDGDRERLGRDERIDFETGTVVVMAVPPSGRGVGDVDGNADERSPGWKERTVKSDRNSC